MLDIPAAMDAGSMQGEDKHISALCLQGVGAQQAPAGADRALGLFREGGLLTTAAREFLACRSSPHGFRCN
jgi:hypothetical protein